jgi:trans-aconitate 2-methyltransferase
MPWDPDRYHQFRRERAAPFEDLLALIERRPGLEVVDLGCGPGELSGTNLTVFEKVYPHVLENADALADWSLGTALVPYLERLPSELHEPFLNRYRAKLRARWPGSPVFYGFRRILFAATVPNE